MSDTIIGLFKGKKKAAATAPAEQKGPIVTPLNQAGANLPAAIRRKLGRGMLAPGAVSDKLGA